MSILAIQTNRNSFQSRLYVLGNTMPPDLIVIMTDTQTTQMVGAYGDGSALTPNLDRLAGEGIRVQRAYTTAPVCTAARCGLFTGMHPQVGGAWCNEQAPHQGVAGMGEIFSNLGYQVAYMGKWHLDGGGYYGDGLAGGGFPQEWWYDGKSFAEDIGQERFKAWKNGVGVENWHRQRLRAEDCWGHRLSERADRFLATADPNRPLLLVVSFNEPHGPSTCPPEFWDPNPAAAVARPDNWMAPLTGKPELQQIQRRDHLAQSWCRDHVWAEHGDRYHYLFACNRFADHHIGRVLNAVDRHRGSDRSAVFYTSDHGTMSGSHGLVSKGPMMYDETTRIPFLVRLPGRERAGTVLDGVASHIDLIPTLLDLAGSNAPPRLHGTSLLAWLQGKADAARPAALVNWTRFGKTHEDFGEFYPIRCAVDGAWKLVVNLLDEDELYDLTNDPQELHNRIHDPQCASERDRLHDWILAEMDRINDPFRSWRWGHRSWRSVRQPFYFCSSGGSSKIPPGFPFQPVALDG